MAFGYIYKITNTINDKVYVGQTTRTLDERFKEHLRNCNAKSKQTVHLYLAMKIYGKENFSISLLDEALTLEELNQKEIYWINYYDSIYHGYNMMQGGQDENPMSSKVVREKHNTKMRSKEVRDKISKSMSIYRNTNGFSEQHREKLAEAARNQVYFGKGDKVTHVNKNNTEKIKELLANGWIQADRDNKNVKLKAFATRSSACYCILITGEQFYFDSLLEAGIWWFENFKPFGEAYSDATYQRKIKASIAGKPITFGTQGRLDYKEVTNIKWYKKTN